ncbi:hypothetical protein EVAR_65918_1 [Eumeta japonica]|uniref:Protein inscuteable homologue C-terminal domain-containing protein n=1 Tax=Eumeta variegata TaxID=151549 RepID=A0A4C2AF51_EUMVA|nr:hypothetical protein EVAR_65918_1 [Eumeta japonica]
MIATLMNIDYDGFASLTNAFVQSDAVRTLLLICIDHSLASVRAQALRALTTICCAPEPIAQLGSCGGIEIIRDILQVGGSTNFKNNTKRNEIEKREAVALLTQVTAAWHGPDHKEQIVAMLYNMSLNKKCHSHLANAGIINFITYTYETEFYKSYDSRGENEAQKRCIKAILHTLTRLVQDSVLGIELLEQQKQLPTSLIFKLNSTQDAKQQLSSHNGNSDSSHGIPFPTLPLLQQTSDNKKFTSTEFRNDGKRKDFENATPATGKLCLTETHKPNSI